MALSSTVPSADRNCTYCGKLIPRISLSGRMLHSTTYAQRRYCSVSCARKDSARVLENKPCEFCGEPIPHTYPSGWTVPPGDYARRRYCSEPCGRAARNPRSALDRQLYQCWNNMIGRCYRLSNNMYYRYGGRGITVCDEWKASFDLFKTWAVKTGYSPDLFLDRQDNEGHYTPENCRWVTRLQNNRNKTATRTVTAFGETKTVAEWAEDPRCAVTPSAIAGRVCRGWSPEDAILHPLVVDRKAPRCPNGHERIPENTYIGTDGRRRCRICQRMGVARYYHRKKNG
jgi:hypothetical protein